MRLPIALTVCVVVSSLMLGCTQRDGAADDHATTNRQTLSESVKQSDVAAPVDNSQIPIKPNFAIRFKAASELTSTNEQQQAFAKLAIDAAKAGDVEIATKSLERIPSTNLHEQITYEFVMIFGKAGKSEVALGFAEKLTSTNQQQEALAKIASGDFGK